MSRPTNKQLRDEIAWLKAKLQTSIGFHVPLTNQEAEVFAVTLVKQGDRFAIVRHRPMGAQAYIDNAWIPVNQLPEDAFAFDAVDAHRLADVLIAEEIAEQTAWLDSYRDRQTSGAEEHLAEYASEAAA